MTAPTLDRIRDSRGFTLIELLIVVVIIGILAAIAIPQFADTKDQAYVAAVKSDLRNATTQLEGEYARELTYADFTEDDIQTSQNVTVESTDFGTSGYCIELGHPDLDNNWFIYAGDGGGAAGIDTDTDAQGVPIEGTCSSGAV